MRPQQLSGRTAPLPDPFLVCERVAVNAVHLLGQTTVRTSLLFDPC